MNWIDVNDELPPFDTEVLVLLEQAQMTIGVGGEKELWPQNPYYRRIGKLRPQFKTNKPFWIAAWGHEELEGERVVVTYWAPLLEPPQE